MSSVRQLVATGARLVRVHGAKRTVSLLAAKLARKLRHERLPNTTTANREVWTTHDWDRGGEEWTPSAEWKAAIIEDLMEPWVPRGSRVLEIGPGGGRWTEALLTRASHVTLVDVTPVCIDLCRRRFAGATNMAFHVNDGTDLGFIADRAVDAIWSYDVFVHIEPGDIGRYVSQFTRILAPGGAAVIHHAGAGAYRKSWRSDMTAEAMRAMADRCGLTVELQTPTLRNGTVNTYPPDGGVYPDVVTVLRRPPEG